MSLDKRPNNFGRYEVKESLGRGSMGQVWLAVDPLLGRLVAIKVIRQDLNLKEADLNSLRERIRQEARAAAQVSHPGIVTLFDLGIDEQQAYFIVSENANGPTLEAALQTGRLTRDGVARLASVLGEAITRAHEHGVIHRDIKPANIILTDDGPKITDFGVARIPESVLTKAGAKLGTPAYSAPEVIDSSEQSAASDQFSFAATLYESLCGVRAFTGTTAVEVARSIHHLQLLPIASELGLPDELDSIFAKAMAREPHQRFKSAQEFGDTLSSLLGASRETLTNLSEAYIHKTFEPQKKRSKTAGYLALTFLLGAISALLLESFQKPVHSVDTAEKSDLPTVHLGVWKK